MNDWIRATLPLAGSDHAKDIDIFYFFVTYLCLFFFIIVGGLTVYFPIKYRLKPGETRKSAHVTDHFFLEMLWTVVPSLLCFVLFFWGFNTYLAAFTVPNDSMDIHVRGRKWNWTFEYPDGMAGGGTLYVPINKPIKLIMDSEDVLHAFYIPAMRVKQDVIPGRYVYLTFTPNVKGTFDIFCAEYCGKDHSGMLAKLKVMDDAEYEVFKREGPPEYKEMKPELIGETIYKTRGCSSCHSLDGTRGDGPTFKGLWGKTEQFADGTSGLVDENYVRQSILEPQAKVVKGFEPVMPTFQGSLRPIEVSGIIAYIKSLK
jgi:cytochrome c oxidase subunit II